MKRCHKKLMQDGKKLNRSNDLIMLKRNEKILTKTLEDRFKLIFVSQSNEQNRRHNGTDAQR